MTGLQLDPDRMRYACREQRFFDDWTTSSAGRRGEAAEAGRILLLEQDYQALRHWWTGSYGFRDRARRRGRRHIDQ